VLGAVDGASPLGVETDAGVAERPAAKDRLQALVAG
jgi:adenosine/AMP kinase